MSDDAPDVTAKDALAVAQRALAKANEIEELRERLDELEDELTAHRVRLAEHDEDRPYDALTRDDKIGMIREHVLRKALDSGRPGATLDWQKMRCSRLLHGSGPTGRRRQLGE